MIPALVAGWDPAWTPREPVLGVRRPAAVGGREPGAGRRIAPLAGGRVGGVDMAGVRYGWLVAVRRVRRGGSRGGLWVFRCDCGAHVERDGSTVRRHDGRPHVCDRSRPHMKSPKGLL